MDGGIKEAGHGEYGRLLDCCDRYRRFTRTTLIHYFSPGTAARLCSGCVYLYFWRDPVRSCGRNCLLLDWYHVIKHYFLFYYPVDAKVVPKVHKSKEENHRQKYSLYYTANCCTPTYSFYPLSSFINMSNGNHIRFQRLYQNVFVVQCSFGFCLHICWWMDIQSDTILYFYISANSAANYIRTQKKRNVYQMERFFPSKYVGF